MITFYYLKEHSSFFLFSHLDSLHWLDKIYKDVRTMEYHFGSSNWSDTEVINSRIKKRILTSKFSFLIYIYYFTSHRQDKVCFVSCQKFVFIYKLLTYQPTTCVRACDNLSSNFFFFFGHGSRRWIPVFLYKSNYNCVHVQCYIFLNDLEILVLIFLASLGC